jgi:hypothetical protein
VASVIIGSTATKRHFPDFPREPKDFDAVVPSFTAGAWKGYDFFSHPTLDDWIGSGDRVATVDELYTLKVSHAYWELKNGSWEKHVFDMRYLRRHGAQLIPDLHAKFYRVWAETHGPKRTNLAMEKGEFFKDAVVRIYDHDSIHDSVAYGEVAMYNQILKEGSTVDVDSQKMWALCHQDLVRLFREEVCATALERIVIPRDYRCSPGSAYRWALRRTITSLTKGKSARFIAENFEEFAIPDDYVSRHLSKKDRLIKL